MTDFTCLYGEGFSTTVINETAKQEMEGVIQISSWRWRDVLRLHPREKKFFNQERGKPRLLFTRDSYKSSEAWFSP